MSYYTDQARTWKDRLEDRIRERIEFQSKLWFTRKFCAEIEISNQSRYDKKIHADYTVMTFLKKYDKKFDRHIHITEHNSVSQDEDWEIVGNEVFVPVYNKVTKHYDTFIYIRSGWRLTDGMDDARKWTWDSHSYDMKITFFGKMSKKLHRELKNGLDEAANAGDSLFIYDVTSMGSDSDKSESLRVVCHESNGRTMDSMVFSHGEDKKACKQIDQYLRSKDFFESRNLHYKTGLLLYGKPGCGKSSLVNALSTKYRRSIISISVPDLEYIDLPELTEMVNCDNLKYIILLEEIDTVFTMNRKKSESDEDSNASKDDKKVISKLLNFLDSNSSPNDVIFIATTNYKDRLDAALTRSGRFDLLLEINPLNEEDARRMIASFDIGPAGVDEVIRKYNEKHNQATAGTKTYNQSDLQAMSMEYIGKGSMITDQPQLEEDSAETEE